MTAKPARPVVPRFVKAQPGQGEKSRWMVKTGTGTEAMTVGFVVCRIGEGYRSGGYWTAFTLYGQKAGGRIFHSRREAANALLVHLDRRPP